MRVLYNKRHKDKSVFIGPPSRYTCSRSNIEVAINDYMERLHPMMKYDNFIDVYIYVYIYIYM